MNNKDKKFKYNVALSFAGEQREYVETVARELKNNGIKVFYDEYEQINMWGRNLVDHFEDIFGNQAEYIVLFLSKEYATKGWPDHERQVVLNRWIEEKEILLPVRFDDSKIKGLPDSIGYLDLKNMSPEELAKAIIQKVFKVKGTNEKIETNEKVNFKLPKKQIKINPYAERKKFVDYVANEIERRCKEVDELDFFSEDVGDKKQIKILCDGDVLYAVDIHKKGIGSDEGVSFSFGERTDYLSGYNAWGNFEWDKEKESVILNLNDFGVFNNFGGGDSKLSYIEFVDKLWDRIVNLLDENNY